MTKSEMIDLMIRLSWENCSQVADLQFFEGEGPFLFAVDEKSGAPNFFCFSFADADEFLSCPEALPNALQSPQFPFVLAEALALDHLEGSGKLYQLSYYKIVPDDPACREAVKKMWQSDVQTASLIALLSSDGILLPANVLCQDPSQLS